MFALVLLTACASPSGAPASLSDENELTIGVPESDVGGGEIGFGQIRTILSVEELTFLSHDGRALPFLAERWGWENDDLRLRVTLRPGVTFHDGTPLTATIVAEILRGAVAEPFVRRYPSLGDVRTISADGELDVVIDLVRRSAFLPTDLTLPIRIGEEDEEIGTGPHRVVKNDATELVLERYDKYYRGTPAISKVVARQFPTLRTAWTSLLRGEVDMVTDVPPDAIEFMRNDDVQVVSFPRRYQYLVAFNSRRPPFTSPAVRHALNLAVDRRALISRVLQDAGTPSTGPLWPAYWAYDSSAAGYAYDPARAASMLDQTGLPHRADGRQRLRFRFTCLVPADYPVWHRVALEVQKSLYAIGVDMRFRVLPAAQFDAALRSGDFDAAIIDMISGPTPMRAYIFWRSARAFRGFNTFGYENPEAERLFDVLRESRNEAAVRTAVRKLQQVFLDDPPALFLAWNERARAIRSDFSVPDQPGRDPLLTLADWTRPSRENPATR